METAGEQNGWAKLGYEHPIARHWILLLIHGLVIGGAGAVAGILYHVIGQAFGEQVVGHRPAEWVQAGLLVMAVVSYGGLAALGLALTASHLAETGLNKWYWPNPWHRQAKIMAWCREGKLTELEAWAQKQGQEQCERGLTARWLGRHAEDRTGGEQDIRTPVGEAILAGQWKVVDWLLNEQDLAWRGEAPGADWRWSRVERLGVIRKQGKSKSRADLDWTIVGRLGSEMSAWDRTLAACPAWLIARTVEQTAGKWAPGQEGTFMAHTLVTLMKVGSSPRVLGWAGRWDLDEHTWKDLETGMAGLDNFLDDGERLAWRAMKTRRNQWDLERALPARQGTAVKSRGRL